MKLRAALILILALSSSSSLLTSSAFAQTKKPVPRDAEVESVKDAYWSRTSEGDVEVVQNRTFTKKHRLSLQGSVGTVSADPFLSIQTAQAALGFHFTESLGLSLVGRTYRVGESGYRRDLRSGLVTGAPTEANVNDPESYMGGELEYSPLYGKISLSGASIVHYDAHFLLGLGTTKTQNGNELTPSIGFGPQFYLNRSLGLRLDYRVTYYQESIVDRVLAARSTEDRGLYSHHVTLGLILFL